MNLWLGGHYFLLNFWVGGNYCPPALRSQGVINTSGFVWSLLLLLLLPFLLLLLLLLLSLFLSLSMSLSLPVRYFMPQSSKNRVFSAIFVPLEEKMLSGIFDVFATSRTKLAQNTAIYSVFWWMRRKHCFLRCFCDKALKMYHKYQCFLHFYYFQLSKQTF